MNFEKLKYILLIILCNYIFDLFKTSKAIVTMSQNTNLTIVTLLYFY